MSDIADFLRARIAERRALAEAAAAMQGDPENGWGIIDPSGYAQTEKRRWIAPHIGILHEAESAEHIVANNPAVVIADLEAKMKLIDLFEYQLGWNADHDRDVTSHEVQSMRFAADEGLRFLAQPFAGHPDHKGEEWVP